METPHVDLDLFDSLSPYEVAVLGFTDSPIEVDIYEERSLVLFGKAAYLWAAAIAYAVLQNRRLIASDIGEAIHAAARVSAFELRESLEQLQTLEHTEALERRLVTNFLVNLDRVYPRVDEIEREAALAYSILLDRGLLEDPFKKKIAALSIAAMSLIPFSFTSATENGVTVQRKINAVAYSYSYEADQSENRESRQVKLKVVEAVKVFKDEVLPAFEAVLDTLGQETNTTPGSEEGAPPSESPPEASA